MPWFKADDRLPDHRKIRQLGPDRLASMGLWLLTGCWSSGAQTDGFAPEDVQERFHPDEQEVQAARAGLVRVGLWVPESLHGEPGHQFHDWADWQPTKASVEAEREAARERAQKSRENRSRSTASTSRSASQNGAEVRARTVRSRHTQHLSEVPDPDPTRPDPTRTRPDVPGGTSGGAVRADASTSRAAVASASGGPPPLPSEIDEEPPRPTTATATAAAPDAAWPEQPCGRRHDPARDCGRCGRANRAQRDQADQAVLAEASRRSAARRRIDGCRACDDNGWLEHPETRDPVVKCDHETDPRKQIADALDQAS